MEKRKKRIVLVALTGLLSSSILVGCNKNHEENSNKIAEIEHNESDFLEVKEENALVQEDQKDSYFTPNLVIVEYKENGERHANVVNVLMKMYFFGILSLTRIDFIKTGKL